MVRWQYATGTGMLVLLMGCPIIGTSYAADLSQEASAGALRETGGATWIPELKYGDESAHIMFYGQINKGVLVYDDGRSTQGYLLVDNDSSSTRFGIKTLDHRAAFGTIGSNIEFEWEPYSTGYVNQRTKGDVDWDTSQVRKAEVYLDNAVYGRVWLGQGSMVSDGTAEVDLSGTDLVGYSSVADIAAAQVYRFDNGAGLSGIQVGDTFKNIDGLGRKLRIRYETPDYNGFTLGTSIGTQIVPEATDVTVWDVAIKYENDHGDYRVSGAAAYSRPGAGLDDVFDGSVSVLHTQSGLSVTVAGAYEFRSDRDARYIYGKIGRQADPFEFGPTALSIDAYYGESINTNGSESLSFGVQAVQSVDCWRTDFYAGVRSYDYDDSAADYKRSVAVMTGARLKF